MRRSLFAVAALAVVVAGCQDHQQPLTPARLQIQASGSASDGHPRTWILGLTYTLSDGRQCTFVEQAGEPGTLCDGVFESWAGFTFNNELYPVIEVCRLDDQGACLPDVRAFFVRKPGEITGSVDRGDGNDKYILNLPLNHPWWSGSGAGQYRVIVAITFTGVADPGAGDLTPVPAWDHTSEKVLGFYVFDRNSTTSQLDVQFRIRQGALCEGAGGCVEISIDPNEENTLVFDTDYQLTTGEGIVGLQFPNLGQVVQQRVNLVLERIILAPGERCISADRFVGSGLSPGRELAPCYNVRTEPYVDLTLISPLPEPIRFGVCLEPGAENFMDLLTMLKWSSVKGGVSDMDLQFGEGKFFDCPDTYNPNFAATTPVGNSRFAATAGRMLSPVASLLMPQAAHASVRFTRSPANGSLMDFSRIVVQADDHYEAVYLPPIGPGSSTQPNLGPIVPTVGVEACLKQGNGCAPATSTNRWTGTAVWQASSKHYQVNWNTPRNQTPGTYLLRLYVRDFVIISPDEINISFGTAGYTHNPGRTLPIKFYLTTAQ